MSEDQPHPLLAQIPLTVSPFVSLPSATTLPYTYKSLPSTLPPSSTGDTHGTEKPKYVVSSSGHAAHPDEIAASCRALQEHLQRMQDAAEQTLSDWDKSVKERELAERRRVAPGWLDRDEKILEPEKTPATSDLSSSVRPQPTEKTAMAGVKSADNNEGVGSYVESREGEELDRAFGGLNVRE
ncbi:MAG: hypothetical protein M1825_001786 [Sarcosagium campestre]|nr:MAG: hypothetical protein M1825_001786 [Sarcosagium campestre]